MLEMLVGAGIMAIGVFLGAVIAQTMIESKEKKESTTNVFNSTT